MILVTGATGHIGNVLVRKLIEKGKQVRALIWRGEDTVPLAGLDAEQVEGDVLEPDSLKPAFRSVSTVFHLAGLISIMPGPERLIRRVNAEGTRNMIAAACHAGVSRFIYTSSIHALQSGPHGTLIDEHVPFDPDNAPGAYGRSKAEASLEVKRAAQAGLSAVIACPTGIIGPYDYRRSEMGSVIMDAALGRVVPYIDGEYDFADVRDVADGLILAAERGQPGETYILSGERISARHLLETVFGVTGRAFTGIRIPFGLAKLFTWFTPFYYRWTKTKPRLTQLSLEVLRSNANFSHLKATRELGYRPRTLHESIVDAAGWFIDHRSLMSGWRTG
jgi:dihydroflavonol-4-reductase